MLKTLASLVKVEPTWTCPVHVLRHADGSRSEGPVIARGRLVWVQRRRRMIWV